MAILALSRAPPKAWASAAYRSISPAARARPRSPAIAASTRGSSWAPSATTSRHPSSATTTRRITLGICSAPPPLVAQRPDTTPPTTYSGWKRWSRTHWCAQVQPWKLWSRASSLYASKGATAGWSTSLSTWDLVEETARPADLKALTICCGESGLTVDPKAALTWSASAWSFAGRMPWTGRGPRRSVSSSSWTSSRQGMPSWPISAAISAPADSAATRRRKRPGLSVASTLLSWSR